MSAKLNEKSNRPWVAQILEIKFKIITDFEKSAGD
jgi:hypothetical protein